MFRFVIILVPAVLSAQAIVSHGVAAASGTLAGAMAGKQVSNVLDKLKILDEATVEASTNLPAPPKKTVPAVTSHANMPAAPGPGNGRGIIPYLRNPATTPRTRHKKSVEVQASTVPPLPGPALWEAVHLDDDLAPAELTEPTVEQLRTVASGFKRDDVLAKLGTPASRVSIPDEGELREVYYFARRGDVIGTVRLTNGVVTSVQPR